MPEHVLIDTLREYSNNNKRNTENNDNDNAILNDSEVLSQIIFDALDYAAFSGLLTRQTEKFRDGTNKHLQVAPLTLLPVEFDKKKYLQAYHLQAIVNKMVSKFSEVSDEKFEATVVKESLKNLNNCDAFINKLINVYTEVKECNFEDYGSFGVLRTDFMLDAKSDQLCLVEINTMASGLASHGSDHKIGDFHRFTEDLIRTRLGVEDSGTPTEAYPKNDMLDSVVRAFQTAYELYPVTDKKPAILFIVEEKTWNAFDQRGHDFAIRKKLPGVDILRFSLPELERKNMLSIDEKGHLWVKIGEKLTIEIALIYFRSGYDPSHFPENTGWKSRLLIEQSRAIKCPNMKTQLLTFKKIQFDLHQNESIFDGITDLTSAEKSCFMETKVEQHILTKTTAKNVLFGGESGTRNLEEFVLKPMTEGGSRLHSGTDIEKHLLDETNPEAEKRSGVEYLLMKKIETKPTCNYLITGNPETDRISVETSQELGIWGVYVVDGERKTVFQETSGYIMRSKYITFHYHIFNPFLPFCLGFAKFAIFFSDFHLIMPGL